MNDTQAREAADSLMHHLRLSDADAAVLFDETTIPQTLRLYVFNPDVFATRQWPLSWRGFRVEAVRSAPFRAAGEADPRRWRYSAGP